MNEEYFWWFPRYNHQVPCLFSRFDGCEPSEQVLLFFAEFGPMEFYSWGTDDYEWLAFREQLWAIEEGLTE